MSRREMLRQAGMGFGGLALAGLLQSEGLLAAEAGVSGGASLQSRAGYFAPRARTVIQLMQTGGPSQMDMFDPKPELQKRDGQTSPVAVHKFLGGNSDQLFASPFKFQKVGNAGMEFSELIPHISSIADEICLSRSMFTEHDNHTEAMVMFNTGKTSIGRPTMGAWVSYALGTENRNLPAFVVLRDPAGYDTAGSLSWSSGWLPAMHQGTEFSSQGAPVANLRAAVAPPAGVDAKNLDFLARLNAEHSRKFPRESELEARIQNYELAARMQLAAGEVLDISRESQSMRALYGLDDPQTAPYGTRCLMARRLVESGVRFVQVYPDQENQAWDTHGKLKTDLPKICRKTDLPTAGLIRDLQSRGLLEETIVVWSGEFGRLPVSQNGDGRDHNRHAFSLFVAGGGFKAGFAYGQTDDFGYKAVTDRMSVADLHATILHQLGIDHQRLAFHHHGRDETLTDATATAASVVGALLRDPPVTI